MSLKEFRTYRRRDVSRRSGFKASGETTGAECKIVFSKRIIVPKNGIKLHYHISDANLVKLFLDNSSLIAFGFYVYPEEQVNINYELSYNEQGEVINKSFTEKTTIVGNWNSCGFFELLQSESIKIKNINLGVNISPINSGETSINICCDQFGLVDFPYFKDNDVKSIFLTKTNLNIPHIFYFNNDDNFLNQVINNDNLKITDGRVLVLKSCNRCTRYLPINIDDERKTLSFSSHCVKRAPCVHASFRNYKVVDTEVDNYEHMNNENEVISYHGHQLECKACKKFFVNAPLNPQRQPEQFKEDGLRRRAFEVLVNNLMDRDLVHHEFKKLTKKEFTKHIHSKFGGKCFKCGKKLTTKQMHLDHTMPLAFLYRLDETATCLCATHNSSKSDKFPVDFYSDAELINLSQITGIPLETIYSKSVNMHVVDRLKSHVVWFFDTFLFDKDFQKIRDGILTADKIYAALIKVLPKNVNLVLEYKKIKGVNPTSITTHSG